jgi:hypothetical protein
MGFHVTRGCKSHKDTCNFGNVREVQAASVRRYLETTGWEYEIAREVNQVLDSNAVSQANK